MWIVWGVVAAITLGLYAYRSRIERDEEGQIFLDEAFDHEKAVQTDILRRVNRIQPVVRTSLALTLLMTLLVIGYYAWFAARSLFG
jgi:hypothetical protein